MDLTRGVVRGDHAAGDAHVVVGCAAQEKQQDVAAGDVECAETLVGEQNLEPEDAHVEVPGSLQVVDVEGCFFEIVELGHHSQFIAIGVRGFD